MPHSPIRIRAILVVAVVALPLVGCRSQLSRRQDSNYYVLEPPTTSKIHTPTAAVAEPSPVQSLSQSTVRLAVPPDGPAEHPVRLAEFQSGVQQATAAVAIESEQSKSPPVAPEPPEVISSPPAEQRDSVDLETAFGESIPIDLASALELAGGRNPQVAYAAQRIEEAVAQLRLAEILWVPSLRAGVNYNKHEGQIQDVVGNMIETSRGSVYTGFGAQAVGAGSPAIPGVAVNFHLRDAMFQPRIAEHIVGARMESSRATLNDTLLNTALAYIDLLEAVQNYAVADETLRNAERLAELTDSFARTGEGLLADADRAKVELSLRKIEVRRTTESVKVASARLARLLSQPQGPAMLPQEPGLAPIELVELDVPLQELVAIGLTQRPELGESQFLVGEAVQRLRREYQAPLLPSVLMGLSYGGNGGGLGSDIENFGDRLDFDAAAYWELRNLGLGEKRARADAAARVESARLRQIQMLDQVASEIAEAHAQVTERQAQIELAELGVKAAEESHRRNAERIREAEGLPIETLQSIQALDQARRQYVRAVSDYNRAQFLLQRALGWPITP